MNFKYKKQNQELRREKVLELTAMGFNQRAISTKLGCSNSLISRDLKWMRQNTHSTVLAINDRLEEEYVNYLGGINVILQESWTLSQTTKDENTKLKALALGKDCFSAKLDLLTNSSVVEDEIKFIKARSKSNEDTESNVTEEQEQTDDKEIVTSGNEE